MQDRMRGDHVTINRSPLRYIGSKAKLIQKYRLWEYLPRIYNEKIHVNGVQCGIRHVYLELFAGSAVLFFNISPVPTFAVINDGDGDLYNFWKVVRDHYDEFAGLLEYTWCGKSWLDEFESKDDPVSRAMAFYIKNRWTGFNPAPVEFCKDFSAWKARMDASRLQVWNLDYKDAMAKVTAITSRRDGNSTEFAIYEDPPYLGTEKAYKGAKFTRKDHEMLARLNHESTHHVFISYEDDPLVRSLYDDWHILELADNYNGQAGEHVELLISNKPIERRKKEKNAVKALF